MEGNSPPDKENLNICTPVSSQQALSQHCSINGQAGGFTGDSSTETPRETHPQSSRQLLSSAAQNFNRPVHLQPSALPHPSPSAASQTSVEAQSLPATLPQSLKSMPQSRGRTPVRVHCNGFQYCPAPGSQTGKSLPRSSSKVSGSNGSSQQEVNGRSTHGGSAHQSGSGDNGGGSDDGPGEQNDGGLRRDNAAVATGSATGETGQSYQGGSRRPRPVLETESTTWAIRNPEKAVQPTRHRIYKPQPNMTDAEKLSAQMRAEQLGEDVKLLNAEIAEVQSYCRLKAEEIGKQFHKKPDYVHRLIHSATLFKQTRNPNLFNALVHKKAREVNSNSSSGDRVPLSGIQQLVREELKETTREEAESAVKELQDHRDLKKKGARATNLAAAHDLKSTLIRLDTELNNLHERTGSFAFALVTRGHVHDLGIPGWAASVDATLFIQDVLKMDIWDLLKKFELWAVTRDSRPNIDTLLTMRTECSSLITDSLSWLITKNKKIIMNYANYERSIIHKYHVKLDGWPTGIPFATPHSISTIDEIRLLRHHLVEKQCKWVKLTDAEVKECMASFAAKVRDGVVAGRKRKVRADKGKPRKKRASATEDVDEEIELGEDAVDEEDEEEEGPRRSRRITKGKYRSKQFIDDEADESDGQDGSGDEYAEDDI